MEPKDLFSNNASDYAQFRPDYPDELFEFVYQSVSDFDFAWDCATGNGQAAKVLARRFKKVWATDISEKQMSNAFQSANVFYSVASAEKSLMEESAINLITVAQAAHWFKLDAFYAEVHRVAKTNGVLAIWGYGLLSINKKFDEELSRFYKKNIGHYWNVERKFIDDSYKTLPFPFKEISTPEFRMTKQWTISELSGYLSTWSAVQKFIKAQGFNPVDEFMLKHKHLLPETDIAVTFPLFLRMGKVK